jgi:hypothetical protein
MTGDQAGQENIQSVTHSGNLKFDSRYPEYDPN